MNGQVSLLKLCRVRGPMVSLQGGLQHFVIGGGKNCMDMDTCSMHVHPTPHMS